mmetsp:Transcript_116342/g.309496  ORF Transcript_116342/g.309496 Transcript_116342/m.309496 type:complete len:257 (+) Transcript_116342:127-897(+)
MRLPCPRGKRFFGQPADVPSVPQLCVATRPHAAAQCHPRVAPQRCHRPTSLLTLVQQGTKLLGVHQHHLTACGRHKLAAMTPRTPEHNLAHRRARLNCNRDTSALGVVVQNTSDREEHALGLIPARKELLPANAVPSLHRHMADSHGPLSAQAAEPLQGRVPLEKWHIHLRVNPSSHNRGQVAQEANLVLLYELPAFGVVLPEEVHDSIGEARGHPVSLQILPHLGQLHESVVVGFPHLRHPHCEAARHCWNGQQP